MSRLRQIGGAKIQLQNPCNWFLPPKPKNGAGNNVLLVRIYCGLYWFEHKWLQQITGLERCGLTLKADWAV
jgi:hypothetical protein